MSEAQKQLSRKGILNIHFIKKIVYVIWFCALLFLLGYYIYDPSILSIEKMDAFLKRFGSQILIVYIIITFIRGIFLLPSTPFILLGAFIYPDSLIMVAVISMSGIIFSATLLYYMAQQMGFSEYLEKKYPKKVAVASDKLNKPWGIVLVIAWSFFPLVPTDVICYVARVIKMRYRIMITGVFLGETPLIILCLYFGKNVLAF